MLKAVSTGMYFIPVGQEIVPQQNEVFLSKKPHGDINQTSDSIDRVIVHCEPGGSCFFNENRRFGVGVLTGSKYTPD
ncbi:hypothetical protein BLJ79_06960 [Arthrobacter sp. UCD-GKA]|nr:hypothetical protein BLJ79_06960 [Arthrobacter sp. UCD-GKA]